jgi:WD40 repeat protein
MMAFLLLILLMINVQAAGCADGIIKLWDVPGKRSLRKLVGHTGKFSEVSLCRTW